MEIKYTVGNVGSGAGNAWLRWCNSTKAIPWFWNWNQAISQLDLVWDRSDSNSTPHDLNWDQTISQWYVVWNPSDSNSNPPDWNWDRYYCYDNSNMYDYYNYVFIMGTI